MAKNALEQLISDSPRYAEYNPSEERQDTNIIEAGTTPTVVQPYEKTNKWLRFSKLLNKVPEVYEMGVDVMQDRAAQKVANMSEGEFQAAYEKIIGGDQGARDLFGYNKAHQEKIVERAYQEVVPLEMKELVTDFKSRLNDFGSIAEFDEAVNNAVDDYFGELDGRFNQSSFANNAHQLLRVGKEAKIKIELHDAYEAQAKEFIESQSLDNVKSTLNNLNGNYDIDVEGNPVDMGEILTKQYNGALGANGGDKRSANQTVVQGVGNQIKELISTGTTQDLENAQELFDETFGSDILVGGKNIFDTTEALKLEIDLRKSLKTADDNYASNAQRITLQEYTVPWRGKYLRAQTIAEQNKVLEDWRAELEGQEDDLVLSLGLKSLKETSEDPAFSKFEARYETIGDYKKLVPDRISIDDRSTAGLISDMDLTAKQEQIFVKLEDDQVTTTLQNTFLSLTDDWQATYDSILRTKLERIAIENPDNPIPQIEIAYKEAEIESQEAMRQQINTLVKREEPKADARARHQNALRLGIKERQLENIYNNPNLTKEEQIQAVDELIDNARATTLGDISSKDEKGNLRAKMGGDFSSNLDNVNALRESDSYSDPAYLLSDYNRLLLSSNRSRSGMTSKFQEERKALGTQYLTGDAEGALEGLFGLYEFRGFTEKELTDGYITTIDQNGKANRNKSMQAKISIPAILGADPDTSIGQSATFAEIPILLGGRIENTIEAIKNNDVDAFKSIASKLNGYTAETLFTAQKFALTGAGFIDENE